MRQLAGTFVVFSLISCAAATEVLDDESSAGVTPIAEVTVEGAPEAIDLDVPVTELCDERAMCKEDTDALKDAKISLAAPFLEVRAIATTTEGGGSTMLVVRTDGGWQKVPDTFLSYFDEDPGCPSIERDSAITEIRVEHGALVVVRTSDREWFDDDRSGPLETSKARACRELDGAMTCGEATVVAAKLSLRSRDDESAPAIEKTFATKYWVDADGEIESEHPYDDDATWTAATAPGT